MLIELQVKNFAIIDSIKISFQNGLNILSGETGAGKSIILKSLALLMGGKSNSDMIRSGSNQSTIEGSFDLNHRLDILKRLDDMGIEAPDKQLIVRRIISTQGKSKVYLNGSLSTLTNLRDTVSPLITVTGHSAPLIEMTGQHENRNLLSRSYHLDLLDHYADLFPLRNKYSTLFSNYKQLTEKMTSLQNQAESNVQKLDFYKFQRDEIKSLELKNGEIEELESFLVKAKSSGKLFSFYQEIEDTLYNNQNSILSQLQSLAKKSEEISNIDPEITKKTESINQCTTLLEDTLFEFRNNANEYSISDNELNNSEERLSSIRKLQKKYGQSVNDIIENLKSLEEQIYQIENIDLVIKKLSTELLEIENSLNTISVELHKKRKTSSTKLNKSINLSLKDLNMKGVIFKAQVAILNSFTSFGKSEVEFFIQSSKNESLNPLAKVASGGELSRILLSLKEVVGNTDKPKTYLFDEVDAGISGETAEKVGKKLKLISKLQQVICITHLPQVAAYADTHFFIEKTDSSKKSTSAKSKNAAITEMSILSLDNKSKVSEIARLLSGEKITKTSLAHAKELLEQSRQLH